MGLKEKQALAGLDFGWAEKRILECTGKAVKIEAKADTFLDDIDAIFLIDQKGAVAVANAIAKVCYNDIGKEAFNEKKVSSVLLVNAKEKGAKKLAFNGPVLELHGSWGVGSDYLAEGEIKEAVENQL
jgi:hypothetical protein